jgi:hypothetical protein
MSARLSARLAWALCAVALVLLALALVLVLLGSGTPLPRGWFPWREEIFLISGFAGASVLGGLIASRRPGNPYGWLWLAYGLCNSVVALGYCYAAYGLVVDPGALPSPLMIGTLATGVGWTASKILTPFLFLLFPTGRLPSRRWRPFAWAVAAAGTLSLVTGPFLPGENGFMPVENPLGIGGFFGVALTVVAIGGVVLVLLAVVPAAFSLVLRYRRASGTERQQIKWLALAASLLGTTIVLDLLAFDVLLGDTLWTALYTAVDAGLYVAVGIAILRYRLYDIDVIINRTLAYGALTGVLVVVYLGSVVLLQTIFRALTGSESQLAVVASTLAIAALFNPLRRRIQAFVDRRFYRRKYDAGETLARFGSRLRDETDLDRLGGGLVGVVRETMQPAHASLWLREPGEKPRGEG